ncbi:TPA: hypothetical protein SMV24_001505 [Proteus mirabilis]|nr:hypothetical protein [Proteus mirabilis]
MAVIQKINVGEKANDGTGDTLRDAFVKANQNFEALNTAVQKGGADPNGDLGKELSKELETLTLRVESLEKTKE